MNNKKIYKFKKVAKKATKLGKKLILDLSKLITAFFYGTIELILKIISLAIGLIFLTLVVIPLLEYLGVFENLVILEPLINIITEIFEKIL